MCGIAAGAKLEKVYELYCNNLERGCFSTGVLFVTNDNKTNIFKSPGSLTLEQLECYVKANDLDIKYVLMHSRAPTNTGEQEFVSQNNHPFQFGDYYVAHNGIITNFKEFAESQTCTVDSNIIPVHLFHSENIVEVFDKYQGLLTCWIYKASTNQVFIAKAGSTLFVKDDYFSSTNFEGAQEIIDGTVHELIDEKYALIGNFNYENPYYV
jgi:glucosamine 6-phosphate synthetase-like amidotransferase/phosphosugar isomerase protein